MTDAFSLGARSLPPPVQFNLGPMPPVPTAMPPQAAPPVPVPQMPAQAAPAAVAQARPVVNPQMPARAPQQQAVQPSSKPPPQPGQTVNGYVFHGGNPADPASWKQLFGEDYLKNLPPQQAAVVKAMVDGRQAPPTSFAMSKPYWQQMIQSANQYDPNFDQTTWPGRVKTRVSFTGGQDANNVTAINTALQHAAVVQGMLGKLNNFGGIPLVNTAVNAAKNTAESWSGSQAPNNAQEAVDALASEARKVFAGGGGGNLTELENWQKNFPINGSPEQQQGALKTFVGLLDSRLDALADKYNRGMGKAEDKLVLLSPHARDAYTQLTGQQPTGASAGPQVSQPNIQEIVDELRKRGAVK